MVLVNSPKRAVPLHHKKRVGQHRKQTKQFSKPYWPYLPMLLVIVLGIVVSSLWSARIGRVLGYSTQISPAALLQSSNDARTGSGETGLLIDAHLAAAAQAKAVDMANHNYWAHVSPSGEQPWQFMTQAGYEYQTAGENLAYGFGTSASVVSAWMNSAEHRANLLNAGFEDVGFGVANASNFQGHGPQTIVVAMYARPVGAPALSGSAISSKGMVLGAATTASVSRIQQLTGGRAPWSLAFVSIIAFACGALVAMRHGLFLRRALVKSEAFVAHHHTLDFVLVCVGMTGYILTRAAAGFIH